MQRHIALAALAGVAVHAPSFAQLEFENNGFSGEASLAGSASTGNTESTDVGLAFKLRHESARMRHSFGAAYDYGSADGADTKNRFNTSYEVNWLLNHRLFSFGRGAYELDEFDGYDYRAVVGGGLGYDILQGETRSWSVQGGPAYRIDQIEPVFDDMGVLLAPAERQTSAALTLGSRFESQVNDAVSVSNTTDITSSSDTSVFFNSAALTADLIGSIAARFSFDVAHDTNPPFGAEETDTITRASLVYSFGAE